MTKDEQVAGVIEPEPEFGDYSEELECLVSKGGAWQSNDPNYPSGEIEWKSRPFISAPTCCTERIVKEWIKMQDTPFIASFVTSLLDAKFERLGIKGHCEMEAYTLFVCDKLGDNALALLEVVGDG